MKRKLPALYLTRSPLVYVLCQVRISAVMALEKYLPDIQERLRKTGFPKFTRSVMQQITLDLTKGPTMSASQRYEFQDKEGVWGVSLAPEFLTVHTSRYTKYEDFEAKLHEALRILASTAAPALSERIGLRYVDLVRPQGRPLTDFLTPRLLGFDGKSIGIKESLNTCEFRGTSNLGKLLIRATQRADGQFLPSDLISNNLIHTTALSKGELICLLDFDHASQRVIDFEPNTIIEIAGELHSLMDEAFRKSVTATALEQWGNTERT
jgi:uncharacterized protein (TIGR04255 family)